MLTFSDEQAADMRALQRELAVVLARANAQRMEAAVAAFACVRCARILLDQYPGETRAALLTVVTSFLADGHLEDGGLLGQ